MPHKPAYKNFSTHRSYYTKRKKALYERTRVKEYFIIDPENKSTTLLTLNAAGVYQQTYDQAGLFKSNLLSCQITF